MTRWAIRFVVPALLAAPALAHPELGNYQQHRVVLSAAPERLDLTLEILFDGERSLHEREAIDTNKDGALSKSEKQAYLDRVQADAEHRVRLSVDGKPARLVALYSPELDLLDSRGVERHPHLLRLTFFAPDACKPGCVVTVEDSLWPDAPAIVLAEQGESSAWKCVPRQPPAPAGKAAPSVARAIVFDVHAPHTTQAPRQKPRFERQRTRK